MGDWMCAIDLNILHNAAAATGDAMRRRAPTCHKIWSIYAFYGASRIIADSDLMVLQPVLNINRPNR